MSAPKPASQLPFHARPTATSTLLISFAGSRIGEITDHKDAAYIVHAANNYPKLAAALRAIVEQAECLNAQAAFGRDYDEARALLRELGEAE